MRRREFIALVAGPSAWTLSAQAQVTRARVAYLSGGSPESGREFTLDILKGTLRDLGWSAEKLTMEERWANGDFSVLPGLARELVTLHPDVIVTTGTSETKTVQSVTTDISIVFMQVPDPVGSGLVASVARPGRNATGFAAGPQILWGKRIELLTDLMGHTPRRLAWLGNSGNAGSEGNWADAEDAAHKIGVKIARHEVSRADHLEAAFQNIEADALLVQWDFLFSLSPVRKRLAELAVLKHLPAAYENRVQVLAGGLMSYGGDLRENYRLGAAYVDRVLKGARAGDLPVIQASRFELVLNTGAAKALGLTIPPTLLARADEVIE
jgi:putative tryptophan/tyrosine transport system substrate-binding protein